MAEKTPNHDQPKRINEPPQPREAAALFSVLGALEGRVYKGPAKEMLSPDGETVMDITPRDTSPDGEGYESGTRIIRRAKPIEWFQRRNGDQEIGGF